MSQTSSPPPTGDVIGDLVALVERETAKLGNRDAWPAILAIAQVRGVSGASKGEFRKFVWQARNAAIEAKRLARAATKAPARQKSWDKLRCRVELSRERKGANKLRAIRSLRRDIVVER